MKGGIIKTVSFRASSQRQVPLSAPKSVTSKIAAKGQRRDVFLWCNRARIQHTIVKTGFHGHTRLLSVIQATQIRLSSGHQTSIRRIGRVNGIHKRVAGLAEFKIHITKISAFVVDVNRRYFGLGGRR
jgi:hypothetical protein